METLLKNELHQLIDSCDDDNRLMQVKKIFEENNNVDWWNELTEPQQENLTQLLNEPDEKNAMPHTDFLKAVERSSMK